ncbi:MAG: LCP family protein, partial [Acidimicrobiia bacterium]
KTVKQLMGISINHVINIDFGGFREAVNRIGCVFVDIDRRYFNDNSGGGENYATIEVKQGYQKLCGQSALDYVRYRHEDNDLVRAARQQEFLRQAKQQVGLRAVFEDRKQLLRIFGAYTQSDISQQDVPEILGLLKLVYEASKQPITEVRFPGTDCAEGTCIEISREDLQKTVDEFIDVRDAAEEPDPDLDAGDELDPDIDAGGELDQPQAERAPERIASARRLAPGLIDARKESGDHVRALGRQPGAVDLPVYFPGARLGRGGYTASSPRSYEIADSDEESHSSYRIALSAGYNGEYYGVQGTTWKAPPILDSPTDERRIGDRTFKRYFDGTQIRLIALQTPQAVYWVSNTLSRKLTNAQMTGIAESLQTADG